MINATHGIISSGLVSGPLPSQTININLETAARPISLWNTWIQGGTNTAFNNTLGTATGIQMIDVSGTYVLDGPYSSNNLDTEFPNDVVNYLMYTNPNTSKTLKLTGLNPLYRYDFNFCSYAGPSTDASDNTNLTVAGTLKFIAVSTNKIYKTTFTVNQPTSGEITIIYTGSTGSNYGCINGFILKEYSS